MPFIERFEEFCERQNCERRFVNNRWLFENGAMHGADMGGAREPPTCKWTLLELRKEFYKDKLKSELDEFNRFQTHCTDQLHLQRQFGRQVPPPPENAAEQLKQGRDRIQQARRMLKEIDEQLAESPEAVAERERQARAAEHQRAVQVELDRINAVRI